MGNENSGAKGRQHKDWSGGIRYLTCVDDLVDVNPENIARIKQWVRTKTQYNQLTGCWEWIGRKDRHNYGMVGLNKKTGIAHRFVWVLYKGTALGNKQVLHKCDNPKCVNLKHLFVGTHKENMTDMISKGRSNAGENHPQAILTKENVIHIRISGEPIKELARLYGVSVYTVIDIRRRRIWKSI